MSNRETLSSFALRLLVLLPLLGAAVHAQAAESASDRQLIESLQQEVRELRERVERLEAEKQQPATAPLPLVAQPLPPAEPVPGGWHTASNWGLLKKGQTDEEVAEILGEPDNRRTVRKFELWEYGDGIARFYLRRLKSWEMPQGNAGRSGQAE
ncbi:MAG: hypothetical protein WBN68_05870 [Sedimenticolaceae bacterium]